MARSDRSSDLGDGSITSDGEDEQAVGPTSPATAQRPPAPWNLRMDVASPASQPETVRSSVRSPISPISRWQEALQVPEAAPGQSTSKLTGKNARFRAMVMKVIHLNRMRSLGAQEPGIDPRSDANSALYSGIRAQCSIEVVDYGAVKMQKTKLTNAELQDFIAHEKARPLWAKVRWINIGGVSWDVIRCLALRYNIHPLAIEDMLHNHQTYSSKADYYSQHLLIRVVCHSLVDAEVPPSPTHNIVQSPPPTYSPNDHPFHSPPGEDVKFQRSSSDVEQIPLRHRRGWTDPVTAQEEQNTLHATKTFAGMGLTAAQPWAGRNAVGDKTDEEAAWAKSLYPNIGQAAGRGMFTRKHSQRMTSFFQNPPAATRQTTAQVTVNELKKEGSRIQVKLRNLFIVLFRDGTLITIHQEPNNDFFEPILTRLNKRDTLLRNSSDAAMLLQNALDLVVDHAVRMVDKYQEQVISNEKDILIRPKMSTVRSLHILSGDLAMYQRTLRPVKTLIYGLRRYDLDRCVATANPLDPGFDEKKVQGFLSHKSKIYLADVMDHMDYILASMEMFSTVIENLIAYTFNVVSYEMNTTVGTLTTMSVIFLPLSFMTGYFGQNFAIMPSVKDHSEAMFWEIAFPIMTVVSLFAFWTNIVSVVHYLQKRKLQDKIRGMTKPKP